MNDDETAANEYVKARKEYDYIKIIIGDIKPAFLDGIEHGRKGYIKADKAVEVVARWVYDFWHRNAQEKDIWGDLPTEIQDMHRKHAKKELGIEKEAEASS